MAKEKSNGSSITRALISPQLIFAVAAMILFGFSIVTPEEVLSGSGATGSLGQNLDVIHSPEVLKRAASTEPVELLGQGKPDRAVNSAYRLSREKPLDVIVNISCGNVLIETGNHESGLRLLKRSVSLAPKSRWVRINYAQKLALNNQQEEAIEQYKVVCDLAPAWTEPRLALADLYFDDGKYSEAADQLKSALESDSNNIEAQKLRGIALARAGKTHAGLNQYYLGISTEQNLKGLPDDIKGMAKTWGSLERAIFQLRQEETLSPDNPVSKLRLGRALLYTGHVQESKDILLRARKKAPANWEIRRNLAIAMKRLGEDNLALSEFVQSVNLERREQRRQGEDY